MRQLHVPLSPPRPLDSARHVPRCRVRCCPLCEASAAGMAGLAAPTGTRGHLLPPADGPLRAPRVLGRALPERPAAVYWLPWPMSRITPASRAAASFANWSCASCSQTATPPSARAWSSTCSRSGSGSGLGLGFGLGFGLGLGVGVWVNVSGPPPARGPRRRRTASPRPCPAAAVR